MIHLEDPGLDLLFRSARTHNGWTDKPVEEHTLCDLYDLLKLAPTSANSSPARFLFLQSQLAKQRLLPALSPGNVDKTMTAPVVVVVCYDPNFFDFLPKLYPQADARSWYAGNPALAEETAFRNSTLQGGYLILTARALGLDCGPMSGFDRDVVDRELLAEYGWKSNFLCNIGYGDATRLQPRNPRLSFEQVCKIQ